MRRIYQQGIAQSMILPLIILVVLVVGGGLTWLLMNMKGDAPKAPKKVVQQITVITPPPPPPPPPEVEEPEPVEEEEVVEEDLDTPEPDDSAPEPAGEDLGLDADGTAGADGFGLKAKRGGRGILGGGGYAVTVKQEVLEYITDHDELRYLDYEADVTFWIDEQGRFERVSVKMRNGNNEMARKLERALMQMASMSNPRPFEAEPVVKLRITSEV